VPPPHPESGQASAELVALLPVLLLCGAIAWQLALTGQALWLCANAARAAARADAVGQSPGRAARSALPRSLERSLRVERRAGGRVRVELRLPLLIRAWHTPIRLAATSSLRAGQ
jgi:hypothetical protein